MVGAHPSGLPLACGSRRGRALLGFPPDAWAPAVASDARQGGDGSRTLLRSSLSSTFPILQSLSSLVPCDLVSQTGTWAIRRDAGPVGALPAPSPHLGHRRGDPDPLFGSSGRKAHRTRGSPLPCRPTPPAWGAAPAASTSLSWPFRRTTTR